MSNTTKPDNLAATLALAAQEFCWWDYGLDHISELEADADVWRDLGKRLADAAGEQGSFDRTSTVAGFIWDGRLTTAAHYLAGAVDCGIDPDGSLIVPAKGGDLRVPLGGEVEINVTVKGEARGAGGIPPIDDDPVCVCNRRQSMHAPDGGCDRFVPADQPDAEATWLKLHGLDLDGVTVKGGGE
jgi:hypothetical protein